MTQFHPNKDTDTSPTKQFPTSPRLNSRRNDASFSHAPRERKASSTSAESTPANSEDKGTQQSPRGAQNDYQLSKLKVANREVLALTKRSSMWQDFYHASMMSSWTRFIFWSAVFFFGVNIIFALLYAVRIDGVANVPAGKPWFLFFFSVETFATVGYGNMHPVSFYAHTIAMAESFLGLMFSAVLTGLVFARFARPRARIIFAHNAVVARHEGQMMWMTRVANERHNHINGAQAKVWLVRTAVNEEGQTFRRFSELVLRHKSNPLFVLNWTIMHPINKSSPLYGMTAEDWAQDDFSFVVILEGTDETIAQSINARHTYHHKDVRWYEQFSDMMEKTSDGRTLVNFQRIHDTHEQPYDPKHDAPSKAVDQADESN